MATVGHEGPVAPSLAPPPEQHARVKAEIRPRVTRGDKVSRPSRPKVSRKEGAGMDAGYPNGNKPRIFGIFNWPF